MTNSLHANAFLHRARKSAGFTLTELMVVIAIIGILAVISLPVIGRITESARRNQTQNEVAALATALRAYINTYDIWPAAMWSSMNDHGMPVSGNTIRMLAGENINGHNPLRISFMEFPERALDSGEFSDPWGNAVYRFAVNLDYENSLELRLRPEDSAVTVRQTVAVWSTGSPNNEIITSW